MVYEILILSTNPSEKINAQIWSSDKVPNILSIKDEAVDSNTIHWRKQEKPPPTKTFQFKNIDEIPEYYPRHYQVNRNEDTFPEFIPRQYQENKNENIIPEFRPRQVYTEQIPRYSQIHIPRIILVAGNVGRNFVKKLIKIENAYEETRYDIFSVLKPGASRDEIIKTAIHISKSLAKNDFIILWPNDVNIDTKLNLDSYMQKFNGKKVLFFSEPYAKNTSKNDAIYAYNRALEREIYLIEAKYPNLKLFDCNYFLRKNNYLGFKHELRGYAKYILAKYVLFCIRFGFGYHMSFSDNGVSNPVETKKESYVSYTKEEIFKAFEMQNLGKPELVVANEEDYDEEEDDDYYPRRGCSTRDKGIQADGGYMKQPSSTGMENNTENPGKNTRRKRRSRKRRSRRKTSERLETPACS